MGNANMSEDKQQRMATGLISYFTMNEGEQKDSLYFDGIFDDNKEQLKRKLKISKYVKGYNPATDEQITRDAYPDKNKVYKARIQVEQWEWEGHNCIRVIAFEIYDCVGENHKARSPFAIAREYA